MTDQHRGTPPAGPSPAAARSPMHAATPAAPHAPLPPAGTFLVIDVGCLECGYPTRLVGHFLSRPVADAEAAAAGRDDRDDVHAVFTFELPPASDTPSGFDPDAGDLW